MVEDPGEQGKPEHQPAERKQALIEAEDSKEFKTEHPFADHKQAFSNSEDRQAVKEVKEFKEGKKHDAIIAQPLPADRLSAYSALIFHPLAVAIESALSNIIALQTAQEATDDPIQQRIPFNQQAQQLVWLAEIMAHCAEELPVFAVDPSLPLSVRQNPVLHTHWRIYWQVPQARRQFYMRTLRAALPASAENWLRFLSEAADASGWRLSVKEAQQRWQDQLFNELTTALPRGEIKEAITIEWINPLDGGRYRRRLRDADAKMLFDGQGRLRPPKKPDIQKRLVVTLIAEEKKSSEKEPTILAYAKAYPEMPGVQAAIDYFSGILSGYGCLATLCRITHPQQPQQVYPVLISQYAGEDLAKKAARQSDDAGFWAMLDKTALTLKIIECLFINPEDYKFDNWAFSLTRLLNGKQRYRLTAFDNDHVFVEPLLSSLFDVKVNVKNGLYCLRAMQEPLDAEAVALFLSLEPIRCLEHWLKALLPVAESSLFTPAEIQTALDAHNCFIPLALIPSTAVHTDVKPETNRRYTLIPGTIEHFYEKWLRIRAALQDTETPVKTPMELLERIEPLLAREYRQTFAPDRRTPEARFATLRTNYVEIKDPVSQQTRNCNAAN